MVAIFFVYVIFLSSLPSYSLLLRKATSRSSVPRMNALKYDPSAFIRVNLKKPVGINLEEVVVNDNRGVYVSEVLNDGSAKDSKQIYKGLILIEVNGIDVKYKKFDEVMQILRGSPTDALDLVFIDNRNIEKVNRVNFVATHNNCLNVAVLL